MNRRIASTVAVLLLAAVAAQATVRGVVTRADTRQPYPGVVVILKAGNVTSVPAYTDANGKFYLQNVPAGTYTMEVRSKRKTITLPVHVTAAPYTDVPQVTVE
jgi:Carboxypeptidase regulatory-like domain